MNGGKGGPGGGEEERRGEGRGKRAEGVELCVIFYQPQAKYPSFVTCIFRNSFCPAHYILKEFAGIPPPPPRTRAPPPTTRTLSS